MITIDKIELRELIIRNRKCDNPRYTFIASLPNNNLFEKLLKLISTHIKWASHTKQLITTIHVTGPFVLHKLIKFKYNLQDIKHLKLDYQYKFNENTFIYINDIVPEKSNYTDENTYSGYQQDLLSMQVTPHNRLNCIKNL